MDYSRLITTTSQRVAPFVVDAVHGSSVLVGRATARPKPWIQGVYEKQPIQTSESTTGGDWRGMDTFDVSDVSTDVNLQWEVKGYYQNITIGYQELGLNTTQAQVINLVKRKMDIAKNAMVSGLGTRFYGLGSGSAIEGLQLQTDAGTYSSAYGGLSRSTYGTYINGQVTPASGGVISFATVAAQIDLCSAASSTNDSTNLIITTKTVWGLVEKLMEAKSRGNYDTSRGYMRVSPYTPMGTAMSPDNLPVGMAGYESLYVRGIPMVKDDKATSGNLYTLNENYLDFVSSKVHNCEDIKIAQEVTKGANSDQPKATAFQVTSERMPVNQAADVRQILLSGNFVNRNPKRSGVITGITTT